MTTKLVNMFPRERVSMRYQVRVLCFRFAGADLVLKGVSIATLLVAALAAATACTSSTSAAGSGGGRGGRGGRGGGGAAQPVVTTKVSQRDVPLDIAAVGNVEAYT